MKNASLFLPILSVAIAAAGCGAKETPEPGTPQGAGPGAIIAHETPAQGAAIANPASVNCLEKGGKLDIVDEPAGQRGICTLPDGTQCDEWAFFRGECPCGPCRQLAPPAPTFCPNGTIVAGPKDACGCPTPPRCE